MRENQGNGNCIICGADLKRKWECYCDKHRSYAKRDDKLLDGAPWEFYFALIRAVFVRARVDYMYNIDGARNDAARFYRTKWAQTLSLSQFDPDKLMGLLDEEAEKYGYQQTTVNTYRDEW